MKNSNLQEISLLAVLTALSVVFGLFIKNSDTNWLFNFIRCRYLFYSLLSRLPRSCDCWWFIWFLIDLIAGYPSGCLSVFSAWLTRLLCWLDWEKTIFRSGFASLSMISIYLLCSIPMYGLEASITGA